MKPQPGGSGGGREEERPTASRTGAPLPPPLVVSGGRPMLARSVAESGVESDGCFDSNAHDNRNNTNATSAPKCTAGTAQASNVSCAISDAAQSDSGGWKSGSGNSGDECRGSARYIGGKGINVEDNRAHQMRSSRAIEVPSQPAPLLLATGCGGDTSEAVGSGEGSGRATAAASVKGSPLLATSRNGECCERLSSGAHLNCPAIKSSKDRQATSDCTTGDGSALQLEGASVSSSSRAKSEVNTYTPPIDSYASKPRELEVEWKGTKESFFRRARRPGSSSGSRSFSVRTNLVKSFGPKAHVHARDVIGKTIKNFATHFRPHNLGDNLWPAKGCKSKEATGRDRLAGASDRAAFGSDTGAASSSSGSSGSSSGSSIGEGGCDSGGGVELEGSSYVSHKLVADGRASTSTKSKSYYLRAQYKSRKNFTSSAARSIRTSVSSQSILNYRMKDDALINSDEDNDEEEDDYNGHVREVKEEKSKTFGENPLACSHRKCTSNRSSNIIIATSTTTTAAAAATSTLPTNKKSKSNMMASTGGGGESFIARNKYMIEDKLRKQQQQSKSETTETTITRTSGAGGTTIAATGFNSRLNDRRCTYCSSGPNIATSMITNFESSLSTANSSSESPNNNNNNNITCSKHLIRDCPGDSIDRDENFDHCKRPCKINNSKSQQQCNVLINTNRSSSGSNSSNNNNNNNLKKPAKRRESNADQRENWGKNIEFLLAVIGFAVDLGNVWRFPYICYKNGGGAFLIPYTVIFILGGLPIFYMEMSLGQYFSSGCLTVWKRVCPMAKGIGYAMCVLNFFTGLYYNTIISWAVFFLVQSFTDVLPWTSCNNIWNGANCRTIDQRQALKLNSSLPASTVRSQSVYDESYNQSQPQLYSSPTKDYFEREVLQIHLSTGIDDLGQIRAPLAIYLAIVFIFIYFAIWKGVKSTGKAVWITALLPYFVLIPLLIRGVFLEGAWLGIKYYLYPQWVKITDVDVWVEAAKQIYFSLGPGFGTLMALSSYNKFNHNCCRDTLIAASVNYFASFISGLVIFAVLGYMATIENVDISDVATEGPGLVFQVYPEGLATMRFSSMWSVLFFTMVISLGIDSTFGGLESVITGLCDEYPRVLRAHRSIFIGILIILLYLCSLPTTTNGGDYVIYVLEAYGTSLSLLFIVLAETIIVCWVYGADRFCKNLEEMYGERPGAYWRLCWKYISPTILLLIFVAACVQEFDKYHILQYDQYTYPKWAPTLGLLMTGSSVCCIPIYAIYYMRAKTSGTFLERLKIASKPIEGEPRDEKEIYVDALTDKIKDENDVHLDTVI